MTERPVSKVERWRWGAGGERRLGRDEGGSRPGLHPKSTEVVRPGHSFSISTSRKTRQADGSTSAGGIP